MLRGLKVIELASVLAGPSVGQFFAELGADVIKVESPRGGGDVTRTWKLPAEQTDDRSAYFCAVNWGKKSLAIDLTATGATEIMHRLAAEADIIIASYKPGDAEKLKVDYNTLSAINPKLIYGRITGYGYNDARVGYDALIQAESGFMDMNGEPEGSPLKMPVALIDILAAHHLKEALLLALLKRERTGEGSLVEVSLIQAAISSLANQATNWLVAGSLPARKGSLHPNIAPYGDVFETMDGKRILLAVGNDRQFRDLCIVLGIAAVADDEKFAVNQKRVENRKALDAILRQQVASFKSDELLVRIQAKKIPAGLIQNLEAVFNMKPAVELLLHGDEVRGIRNFVASGIDSQENNVSAISSPPHLGQHTSEVLESIGLSDNEIQSLRQKGIVK